VSFSKKLFDRLLHHSRSLIGDNSAFSLQHTHFQNMASKQNQTSINTVKALGNSKVTIGKARQEDDSQKPNDGCIGNDISAAGNAQLNIKELKQKKKTGSEVNAHSAAFFITHNLFL